MVKKRDAVLQVYVTPEEKAQIEAAAMATGLSVAAYLRSLAIAELAKNADVRDDSKTSKK